MFTGIIEELGRVDSLLGGKLTIQAKEVLSDLRPGASISVNGVCLTAIAVTSTAFCADLSPETLQRTNLGDLGPRDQVNLERPLSPSSRLSGHIVQGHVDGTGELIVLEPLRDGNWWLSVRVPPELDHYLVFKGSIAIDGISLTIASLEGDRLGVAIIPHTYRMTTLSSHRPGDRLNLECDIIAKHVEKLLASMEVKPSSRLTVGRLRDEGF